MSEENTEQEKPQEEEVKIEPQKGNERDLIKEANEAAARLEAANMRHNELLDRQEKLKIQETLGGTAEAGTPKPKEESPKEYAEKVLKGEL